jgi:signal transduction histidine kinase
MISIVPMLAILTTAAELRQAVWERLSVGETFAVTGTVTTAMDRDNPDHTAYAIMDASGCTYAKSTDKISLDAGSIVAMRGHIGIDKYNWQHAFINSAEVLGKGDEPKPMPITAAQLSDVSLDSRLVSMNGIVTGIVTDEIDPRWKFVLFRSDLGPFVAAVIAEKEPLERLVGAKVTAMGVANVLPYVGRRKFMIPQLLVRSENEFSVVTPAPEDPFSAPKIHDDAKTKIENLRHQSVAAIASMGLRRIDGRVLAVAAGQRLLLRTEGGQLCGAILSGETPPRCGDAVAVTGFPETDLFRLNLTRATWKALPPEESASMDLAEEDTVPATFADDFDMDAVLRDRNGSLVTMHGTVVESPSENGRTDTTMILSCGGRVIPIDVWSCRDTVHDLPPGSEVDVTGVVLVNTGNWNPLDPFPRISGFTLVPRSPADVRVIRTPSWWTAGRLAVVVAALFALIVFFAAYNRALAAVVRRRSRQLLKSEAAKIESDLRIDERTRLATEIHDAISQTLTGVSFQIDAAAKTLPTDTNATARFLAIARRTLLSCREELRRCIWDLRSNTLGMTDFSEAVEKTVRQGTGEAKVSVRIAIRREQLSDSTAHAILCIVRELAVNAARHGKAHSIEIAGALEGDAIRLSVSDDGCGFDPSKRHGPAEGHFGLQGVKERLSALGGTMRIESSPGKGAKVTVEIGK